MTGLVRSNDHSTSKGAASRVEARKRKQQEIEQAVSSAIYGDLLASQRDLDESATDVLYGNLWDMYE